VQRLKDFDSDAEREALLIEYERRRRGDRERLDTMIRYAQTTECRVRFIARYFAAPMARPCARCDNCRARAAGRLQRPARAARRDRSLVPARVSPFTRGDWVSHRTFGRGEVIAADAEAVTAVFVGVGQKAVDPAYVRLARPPRTGAGEVA
jgi:hypothetical protein